MRLMALILTSIAALETVAQTTADSVAHKTMFVVCDIETGVPVRDVKVHLNTGKQCVTDYRGRWLPDSTFESATVTHPRYLSRVVERWELNDTLYLLPKCNTLGDVTVWGVDRRGIKSMVKRSTSDRAAYSPPAGMFSFDFFDIFRKKPLNAKARKKNRELLENWDRIYTDPLAPTPKATPQSFSIDSAPTFVSTSFGIAQM